MKLFQKGFLLVAVPILGQFIFVLFLIGMYRTSEELAWKEMHFRTQTQELMSTSVLMYKCVGVLSIYGISNQSESLKTFDRVFDQLQRKVELLTLLNQEQPSTAAVKAKESFQRMMRNLYAARQMVTVNGPLGNGGSMILIASDLKREIEEALTSIEVLIAERVKEGLTDAEQMERSRTIFLTSIILGFAVNMLLCAVLLLAYARDFAKRFNLVMENTHRVTQGLPLNAPIAGKDELSNLDQTLHEMNHSLKLAQARKEQLMNMVSHDLRGPLTSVQITLEMLLNPDAYQLPEKAAAKLAVSDKLVKRLSRLVNDVLDFDKLKVGKLDLTLDVVSLRELFDDCVGELAPVLDRENMSIEIEDAGYLAIADRERLPQIVLNLLTNAIKFSPSGSSILLSTSLTKSADNSKNMVRIAVEDQGPGVPEEYRQSIFLPFEQVPDNQRPNAGTTGLGLPICKMLAELHGGEIGVEVKGTGGSIFWFTLPEAEIDEL